MINLWGSDPKTPKFIEIVLIWFLISKFFMLNPVNRAMLLFLPLIKKMLNIPIKILRAKNKVLEVNYDLDLMVYFSRLIKNNQARQPQIEFAFIRKID